MKQNLSMASMFVIVSAFCYAALSALVKYLGVEISVPVIVFLQSTVSLLVIIPIVLMQPERQKQNIIHSKNKKIHFARTIASLGISYFLFTGLHYIPLVNAIVLVNTSPLFVPFLGLLFLKKKIKNKLWPPIIIGFIGVIVVLHPSVKSFNFMSFLPVGASLCMAISMLLVRNTSEKGDSALTSAFYYFLFSTIVSGLVSIPFWQEMKMTVLFAILISGVMFFIVQYALTMSLAYAEAQFISSLYYSNILFATLIGMMVFQTHPSLFTWIGIALIIIGGIATIRVQHLINRTCAM